MLCPPLGLRFAFECTSIWFLISVVKPPTACNCSPISRQSAPVVRQRSSSAWPSGVSDPWGRTVWPRPATPQATKILARCLTRLSTGQPRLYGDFSVTCLTHRYLMYLVEEVGIEPTCPEATGLQPARTPLFHFLQNFYWGVGRDSNPQRQESQSWDLPLIYLHHCLQKHIQNKRKHNQSC